MAHYEVELTIEGRFVVEADTPHEAEDEVRRNLGDYATDGGNIVSVWAGDRIPACELVGTR